MAIAGNRTDRRPLNEEHRAAPGKKSGDLASLNPANLHLIGAHGKNGRTSGLAKIDSVLGSSAENGPTDTRACSSFGDLRKGRSADGLDEDSAGPKGWFRLDGFEELRALREDRKSTRLNSSHSQISYAVFCLKKNK